MTDELHDRLEFALEELIEDCTAYRNGRAVGTRFPSKEVLHTARNVLSAYRSAKESENDQPKT